MNDTGIDEYYMKEALKEAHRAFEKDEVPVGAVVVCGGRIVARAHNLTETLNDPTAHAEMQAITSATASLGGKYLDGCTLYVTLEPCTMCAGAIFWSQAERLVFGAPDPKRGYRKTGSDILHPSTTMTEGILKKESEKLIKDFFSRKR